MSSLRDILAKVRSFLAVIAPMTPITLDDALIPVIDAILKDSDLFGWFSAKVDQHATGVLSLETDPPVALQASLERHGIKWAKLLDMLPAILEIVRMFKG